MKAIRKEENRLIGKFSFGKTWTFLNRVSLRVTEFKSYIITFCYNNYKLEVECWLPPHCVVPADE